MLAVTLFVDANIAIALLNVDDAHHQLALSRLAAEPRPRILSLTWGEAMVRPQAAGSAAAEVAARLLDRSFERVDVDQEIVETATRLRARARQKGLASSRLPMLDAVVVAAAIEHADRVLTSDRNWPVTELRLNAQVEVLRPGAQLRRGV